MELKRFKRILFLSGLTKSAVRIYQQIEEHLPLPVLAASSSEGMQIEATDLLFIDASGDHASTARQIGQIELNFPHITICLYGAATGEDLDGLLEYPIVRGVITHDHTQKLLLQAILTLDRGDCWFSRSQFNQVANLRQRTVMKAATLRDGLTRREQQVLGLIAAGLNSQAIADRLFVSLHTVKTHKNNLYRKLDAHSEQQLLRKVARAETDYPKSLQ